MKRRLMKKAVAVVLSGCFVFVGCMTPVIAEAGEGTVTGSGYTTNPNSGSTYGGQITGGQLSNNGETEINVQAKVTGGAEIVYNIDLSWGAMQFEYDYGSTWDPASHNYVEGTSGRQGGGWVASYLDGEKNKITVTNNSNFPVKASFLCGDLTSLNADTHASRSVIGIFSDDKEKFVSGDVVQDILDKGYNDATAMGMRTKDITLEMDITHLAAATKYYKSSDAVPTDGSNKDDIYFALSGRPDSNSPTIFTDVGNIKVTISPVQNAKQGTKQ